MTGEPTILTEQNERVLVITLNRPGAKNAFNHSMYREVASALESATEDLDVRCVVITGAGDAFSAGQDLTEMGTPGPGGEVGFERLVDALVACDLPVLAAVNGVGVGIGCTLLLHTDLNYIAQGARLRCPFVPLGVVPEAGSSLLLPQTIGMQRTAEFLFTGRWLSSAEAVQMGIAIEEVAPLRLIPSVLRVAQMIAQQPRGALTATKRLMRQGRAESVAKARTQENEAFVERLSSEEHQAALATFFSRRA